MSEELLPVSIESVEEDDLAKLYSMFGEKLPNPEQYPKVFQHYVKLFYHMKKLGH